MQVFDTVHNPPDNQGDAKKVFFLKKKYGVKDEQKAF